MKARLLVTLFVTVVTATSVSAQTPQATGHTVSGVVRDQLGLAISGVEVAIHGLTVPDARKVKTDEKGYYEFAALPAGQYVIRTSRPGFRVSPTAVVIEAADVSHDIGLRIGSVLETVQVTGFDEGAIAPRSGSGKHRKPPRCQTPPRGGDIVAPVKVFNVSPLYPKAAYGAKLSGLVQLVGTISTEGHVINLKAFASTAAVFEQPALDAVSQWEFDTMYLDCVPQELDLEVDISFAPN